jgi:alcohol dehydrogenase class IV
MSLPSFTFQTPPKIVFGWGTIAQLPKEAAALGKRPLLVCGNSLAKSGALDRILASLTQAGLTPSTHVGVPAEPGLDALKDCMDATGDCDSVIAVGGGSVLDIAKGAAALAGTGVTAREYFGGVPVPDTGRPLIAVPTTSGTGSEVTWVCVLVDHETRRKASIRGPGMMPAVALVDPELTVTCPSKVTAYSGMDAFVQAVEAYTSSGANPMTDALALQAAKLTGTWVSTAVFQGKHREAREAMALGSMMAGVALNTARLGLVHGLAHPLGAVTGAAHGLLCGLLMPPVMKFNREVSAAKYARVAEVLGILEPDCTQAEAVSALIDHVRNLNRDLGIPANLSKLGFKAEDLEWVAQETMPSGSSKANPRRVTIEEARTVALSCV